MDRRHLLKLFADVKSGALKAEAAAEKILNDPYEDILFAKVDHHRAHRQGFCEVIFSAGKTPAEVAAIAKKLLARGDRLLATRADKKTYAAVKKIARTAVFHERSGAITVEKRPVEKTGDLLVLTAGTSDIPVAEEAAVTARIMGINTRTVYDVGVAGIHRILDQHDTLKEADCIIVAAGMDGALASVVGGMVAVPVIAVPTSVGYGAAFGGIAPLLAMLNSCASGVAVVNIDNGFGAAALARRIIKGKYGK